MKARILGLLPEEEKALSRLWLNATDAAKVCGVTVRQLTYWTDKGIIPSSSESGRNYDVAALNKAMAIDRAMLGGLTLEKAARLVEETARVRQAEGATGEVLPASTYIDGVFSLLEDCRHKLPAYLAMANFRRSALALEAVELEMVLGSGAETGEVAQLVAARLNAVADVVYSAMADLVAPPVAPQVEAGEMAGAGSGII